MYWLEQFWYRISPLHLALWPLSLVFGAAATVRRLLYRVGIFPTTRLKVPVIIVGNITVGGTGKTPCVIWLANWLREHGYRPGIVSRGYGGTARSPLRATADSDPRITGDEAVLLARRCVCPVWVGGKRVAAAQALLVAHPDCNVIISDDGLQHFALARDVELAVIDGVRGCGNGMLLPAGPMREPLRRLARVDALIINGGKVFPLAMLPPGVLSFEMRVEGGTFYNIRDPRQEVGAGQFAAQTTHGVAGIGNPQRFFNHLRELGVSFTAHPFPDHHAYIASDCAFGAHEAVIMTEKDAVKCARLAGGNWWALRVDAVIDRAFGDFILHRIGK